MPEILAAHHTSFTVSNLDRSVHFFQDLLGLELLWVREIDAEYLGRIVGLPGCVVRGALFRIGQGHHLELFEYLSPRGESRPARPCDPGSSHLALLVDDLLEWHRRLADQGVEFVSEPVEVTAGPNRGGWGVYMRDPNGVLIELFQPPRGPAA